MKPNHLNNRFTSRPQSSRPSSAFPRSLSFSKHPAAAVALLALIAALPSARAATFTWNGTSNAYNTGSSWVDGAAPASNANASTDDVVFSNLGSASFVNPTLAGTRVLQSLTFTADAFAYTFDGAAYTMSIKNTGGLVNNSAATQTFNTGILVHTGNSLFTNTQAGGSLVFNGNFILTNSTTNGRIPTFGGVGTITVNGVMSNGGTTAVSGATITSTGATTFSGNNTYDGTTTMNAVGGLLSLNGDNFDANGAVTITAGTVKIGHGNALGSTTGATSVASGAVLDLNGQTVGAEAVSINGTGISSGGALVNTSATSASLSGAVTLAGDASIGGTGNIALVNIGQSGGTRGLTKVGAGTLTISGTKSYTGTTTIAGGTLDITGGNSAAGTFTLSGSGGPVLKLSHVNALATTATIDGTSSSGLLGTLDLAAAGNFTLGTFSKGNVRFSASSGESTTLTFTNNSTVSSGSDGGRTLTNSSSNLHVIFGGDLDISSTGAGGVTFAGAGNTTVNGAIFNGSGQTRTLAKSNSGTLTLNAANTYSGATTISQGTLALGASGSIANSTSITVGASATFNVSAVTGGYNLGATQTLSGSGTVTGAMTVAGTLSPGSSPGILLTGNETWVDGSDYNFQMLDATGVAGTGFDQIQVTGTLNLSSLTAAGFAINLWSLSSTGPDVGGDTLNFDNTLSQSWNILTTTGGITGFEAGDFLMNVGANNGTNGFSNALGGGSFSLDADANNLILNFTPVPEPHAALLGGLGLLALLRRRR